MDTNNNRRMGGIVLVGIGILFLLGQFLGLGTLWPLFVIIPGLIFLSAGMQATNKGNIGLVVPGSIITGVGSILMYQTLTGHWASWAYIWTLIPVFLGWALAYMGRRTGNTQEERTGEGFMKYGLMAFAGFALFFEALIFNTFGWALPLALLAVGAWLIFGKNSGAGSLPKRKYAEPKADIEPTLKRKIEQALAEDDEIAQSGRTTGDARLV